MEFHLPCLRAVTCAILLSAVSLPTAAEPSVPARTPPGAVLDQRYGHNHYYPPRGSVVRELPPGHATARRHGVPYYFRDGVWYRAERSGWVVVTPPVGLVIAFLPPFYTSLWINGAPYYYLNEAYYAWQPALGGYVVVEPPPKGAAISAQPRISELYVYPKNGQSAERQATDRYECHRWALQESGFDPTLALGGVAADQSDDRRAKYFRALTACLEGRGYAVK